MRKRLYEILEHTRTDDPVSHRVNIGLMIAILSSVIIATLDTVPTLLAEYGSILRGIEYVCVAVFCVEYVLRIWASSEHEKYAHPVVGRLRFMLKPLMLIDLLSILPAFLSFLIADLLVLRSIRLLRLMRILKLGRYSKGFVLVADVLHEKREELLAATSMIFFLLFFSSSVMFLVEREAQPQTFNSIIDALWWGVSTITSVGYGDILPVTPAGKCSAVSSRSLAWGFLPFPPVSSQRGSQRRSIGRKRETDASVPIVARRSEDNAHRVKTSIAATSRYAGGNFILHFSLRVCKFPM